MTSTSALDRTLLEFFAEQTGFPDGVLSLDAPLGDFLGLRGDHLAHVLQVLEERTGARGLASWIERLPAAERTIERLGQRLREQHAVFREPVASVPAIFQRFVFRTVDEPIPAGSPTEPQQLGRALLLGRAPAAEVLAERLRGAGADPQQIAWSDDAAVVMAEMETAFAAGPVTTLFLLPSTDEWPAAEGTLWTEAATRRVRTLFAVCQHWLRHLDHHNATSDATLVAVTSLGGDFGLRNPFADPISGAVAGLFKAIQAEWEGRLKVKEIDVAAGEPAKMVAAAVWRELAAGLPDVEVACVKGRREVIRAIPLPIGGRAGRSMLRGGAWVITGGARGIMARAAAQLGRRYGAHLHLIGSHDVVESGFPFDVRSTNGEVLREAKANVFREARAAGRSPDAVWSEIERSAEIRATLEKLTHDGLHVTWHVCDVTDREAVAATLDRIRAQSGPIRGVLHGAGFESPGRLLKRTDETVHKTIAARVAGAAALLELTADDPLEAFVLFGSLAGRFGGPLQADYSLACDLATKVVAAAARQRPSTRLVAIDWPNWDETGMSCRAEHRFLLDRSGIRRMSVREGLAHLVAEIEADIRDSEVAFLDPAGPQHTHPSLPAASSSAAAADCNRRAADAPLVESLHLRANGSAIGAMTFDPVSDPFLTAHRDGGVPILPAVMAIEAAVETACLAADQPCVGEILDVKLIQGFRMPLPVLHRADVLADLAPQPDGTIAYACRLAGNFYTEEGRLADPGRVYQSLIIVPAPHPPQLPLPPAASEPSAWIPVGYTLDWRDTPPAPPRTLFYGPELATLRAVAYDTPAGSGQGAAPYSAARTPIANAWGRLIAPSPAEIAGRRTGTAWRTPPSLLDGVLVGCDMFASHLFQGKQLPQAIERIRFGRPPRAGEKCLSRAICYGRDGRQFVFDLWLLGESGDPLIHIEGARFVDRNVAVKA